MKVGVACRNATGGVVLSKAGAAILMVVVFAVIAVSVGVAAIVGYQRGYEDSAAVHRWSEQRHDSGALQESSAGHQPHLLSLTDHLLLSLTDNSLLSFTNGPHFSLTSSPLVSLTDSPLLGVCTCN